VSLLHTAADLVLHLDRHLVELLMHYHIWIYAILFAVIFAETGLVVTPILPGDSLLFGVGALAAVDASHTLQIGWAYLLLAGAAILGNSVN
jgi:membrane-associated protein